MNKLARFPNIQMYMYVRSKCDVLMTVLVGLPHLLITCIMWCIDDGIGRITSPVNYMYNVTYWWRYW